MNINPSNSAPLRRATSFLFIAALLAGCATPPPGGSGRDVAEPLNYEGLETVSARRMDIAQVRPGTDFSLYNAVLMRPPELAYRTPDRSRQEFPLSGEQQAALERLVTDVFESELDTLESRQLAAEPGPNVLELVVRLQDVTATVPPRAAGAAGRTSIALRAVGDVTLVLELSDSQSNEILARAVDRRAVEGIAIVNEGEVVTRWEDVEALCRRWARITRQGLESLLSAR